MPFADRNVSTIADLSYGPVATRLGMLATVMERWEDAERHFRAGLDHCQALRAPTFTVLNLSEHARMLLARDEEGHRQRALALLADAERLCRTVMRPACSGDLDGHEPRRRARRSFAHPMAGPPPSMSRQIGRSG